jgi:hypothetical protein
MHNAERTRHNLLLLLCILHAAVCITACSVPNLEKPECTEAREAVKRFYSFHFGNDMRPTAENLKMRERFLTPELAASLDKTPTTAVDYFTATEQAPKTFKIGKCEARDSTHAEFQVQLYWRDDIETVQKEIHAEAVKTGDAWLINKVSN